MRIKTEILGVEAIVPPRIVNKVKILKKNKQQHWIHAYRYLC